MSAKKKNIKVNDVADDEFKQICPNSNPIIAQILFNRGIKTSEDIEMFLEPNYERDIFDPFVFNNMRVAVERIFAAAQNNEKISVHGDYDADGVCGTAMTVSTLRDIYEKLGKDSGLIDRFIPDRELDGYGFLPHTAEKFAGDGTKLIITVDCGISSNDAVNRAKELGMDTIICDHHAMPEVLPQNAIILHPGVPNEAYPNKFLCGTGVALKLCSALISRAKELELNFEDGCEKWLYDLAAIATVTDVVSLLGENRSIEHFGLKVLNKTRRVGLKKLIEAAGLKHGAISSWSIGFQIGPRINAAGRIDHADTAFKLLIEKDDAVAQEMAAGLNQINTNRQKISNDIFKEALEQVNARADKNVLFAINPNWQSGIVGLIAGKIAQEFNKPSYVIGKSGDFFVGSGRGVKGFDVTRALHAVESHLIKFGGHPQACGFTLKSDCIFDSFVSDMNSYYESCGAVSDALPDIEVDAEIDFKDITWEFYDQLLKLEPHGEGNRKPLFLARAVRVAHADLVGGARDHLKLTLESKSGKRMKAIGFKQGDRINDIKIGGEIDIIFEVALNEWNGNRELQLQSVHIIA